jgi:thymidylate synthase
MNSVDKQYLTLLEHILENGVIKEDRTGTGTISIFDYSMTFDMAEGFPLLTSKKVFTKGVIHELIWFLRGDTNIKYLVDNDVHIWDGDAYKNYERRWETEGKFLSPPVNKFTKEEFINEIKTNPTVAKELAELGPIYGKQWRKWKTEKFKKYFNKWGYEDEKRIYIDQIQNLIRDLKSTPDSRRLLVSAWNVSEIDDMALPPCHFGFQCYTEKISLKERIKWWCDSLNKNISFAEDATEEFLDQRGVPKRKLSLKWFQRSVDVPLGLPFNIASYALLLHLLAKECNMVADKLIFNGGDCHIYQNQIDGVKEQLTRKTYRLPSIKLNNKSIFDIEYSDINIVSYQCSDVIKFPLSN